MSARVIASGHPKSGCHALVKALHLLGWPCQVEHREHDSGLVDRHVFIKRDPRNVAVSWVRWLKQPVTEGTVIAAMRNIANTWKTLPASLAEYQGWLHQQNTLVVSYEALTASPAELHRMAKYLGSTVPPDAWPNLLGGTETWSGQPSDWQSVWTPGIEQHWQSIGGAELLRTWGYA